MFSRSFDRANDHAGSVAFSRVQCRTRPCQSTAAAGFPTGSKTPAMEKHGKAYQTRGGVDLAVLAINL